MLPSFQSPYQVRWLKPLRSLKRRAYEILISDNNLVDSLISVFATVSEWIFVLDLHREPRRVRIGLTFDLGTRPPLPNDRLFGIILGDPRQRKLQFSRTDYQQDNHYPRNDLVRNIGQQLSNWQTIFPFCWQTFLVRTIRAFAARAGFGSANRSYRSRHSAGMIELRSLAGPRSHR